MSTTVCHLLQSPPDVIGYIFDFIDHKSKATLRRVCKLFHNLCTTSIENSIKVATNKKDRYLLLREYVKVGNYLGVIYFLKHDISGIIYQHDKLLKDASKNGHLKIIILLEQYGKCNWDNIMTYACYGYHLNVINYAIEHNADVWNDSLHVACIVGNIESVKFVISKGAIPYYGMNDACANGHLAIVNYLISTGANNWNDGLAGACEGGHIDIINLMIGYGADDWNHSLLSACHGGHFNIVKMMIDNGANKFNDLLWNSFIGGDIDIIDLIIQRGGTTDSLPIYYIFANNKITIINKYFLNSKHATTQYEKFPNKDIFASFINWNDALGGACKGGHKDLIKLAIEKGADDWFNAFCWASRGGHVDIMNEILKKYRDRQGAIDFAFYGACQDNKLHIVELLLSYGVSKIDDGYDIANDMGYTGIVKFLENLPENVFNEY